VIDDLISEVSYRIQQDVLHRWIAAQAWTEYIDGNDDRLLLLAQGPVNTVTSVHYVAYESDGANGMQEDTTEVYAYEYLVHGLASESERSAGMLRKLTGVWHRGARNYKVVYNAGFTDVPEPIVSAATLMVASEFVAREQPGISSFSYGEASQQFSSPRVMWERVEMMLDAWRACPELRGY